MAAMKELIAEETIRHAEHFDDELRQLGIGIRLSTSS
jgi:hypothetical protein